MMGGMAGGWSAGGGMGAGVSWGGPCVGGSVGIGTASVMARIHPCTLGAVVLVYTPG